MRQFTRAFSAVVFAHFVLVTPAVAQSDTPDMVAGHHCLSRWNASNSFFIDAVKVRLRQPRTFVHILTTIEPVNAQGVHLAHMRYRYREGGLNRLAIAVATIDHKTCHATLR